MPYTSEEQDEIILEKMKYSLIGQAMARVVLLNSPIKLQTHLDRMDVKQIEAAQKILEGWQPDPNVGASLGEMDYRELTEDQQMRLLKVQKQVEQAYHLKTAAKATPKPTTTTTTTTTQPSTRLHSAVTFSYSKTTTPPARKEPEPDKAIQAQNQQILALVELRERAISNEGRLSARGHNERFAAIKEIKRAIDAKMESSPNELIDFNKIVKDIKEKLETTDPAKHQQFVTGIREKSTRLTGGESQFAKMRKEIAKISAPEQTTKAHFKKT